MSHSVSDAIHDDEKISAARVLVVDDDVLVTASLRSFLLLELDLEPTIFNDSAAALAYLGDHDIDMVISDFLMPGVNGIELLEAAKRLRPEAPRVLLTGYADKRHAIAAINQAQVFRYIEKPWDNEQLRQIVVSGVERSYLTRQLLTSLSELSADEAGHESFRKSLVRALG